MAIIVYNTNTETRSDSPNNYNIMRPSILSNPYTHLEVGRTRALYQCKTREESIEKYSDYFDTMYSGNIEFKEVVDEIYDKYKNGETIYLECCCKPLPCHGDIIAKKLQGMLIKERLKEYKRNKKV